MRRQSCNRCSHLLVTSSTLFSRSDFGLAGVLHVLELVGQQFHLLLQLLQHLLVLLLESHQVLVRLLLRDEALYNFLQVQKNQ